MSEHTPNIIANRYQITERIGQGGMGDVFKGIDTQTGQEVAIKRLKPDILEFDPNLLERFEREGEALRKLNHPNIVKMLDTVAEDGQHYLVLQYVGGGSLRDLLDASPWLPVERVLALGIELADALTRAHHLKIIHRDLKPANVLLDDEGTPLLTDFGVARIGTRTRVTETGSVIGTYAYLSPEACMGEDLDARADIWSFGVMLYEMVAGQRPFDSEQSTAILLAIMNNPLPDLAALRPDVPPALIQLIGGMLQKDREQRVPSVRVVGAALEAIQAGAVDTSLPPSLPISGQQGDPGSRFATPTPATGSPSDAPAGEEPLVIFGPPTGELPAQPSGTTPTPTAQIPGQHTGYPPGPTPVYPPGYTPMPAQPDTSVRWKSLTIMFTVTVVAAVAVLAIVLFSGALGGDSGDSGRDSNGGAQITPGDTPPPTLAPGQPPPTQPGMPPGPDQTGPPPGPVSEYIVLVADLEPVGEVDERDAARFIYNNLVARLEREIPFSNIRVQRYTAPITDAPTAQQAAIDHQAAVIVWGTYDSANVQLEVQVGMTGAFPYVDQAVSTGTLDRRLLETTANVTVRLTDEREQSVAIPVLNVLNVLQTADGNAYETIRLIAIMDTIETETGEIVSGGVGASLHEGQLLYLDETDRAVEAYTAAIDLYPSNPLVYMYRASAYLRLGDTDRALRDIDTAERLDPTNWTTPLYLRATYTTDPDTLDESIATLDQIIAQRPDDWFAYNYRAGLYYLLGNYDQAQTDLNRAIDLGPNANFPYLALFTIALRAGRFEDLQNYLETTLTNFADPTFSMRIAQAFFGTDTANMPVFGPMYGAFGELLLGQYERALEDADQALAINPNIADLYLVQGLAHCALGDYQAAEAAYTHGIEAEPDYIALYALRAETHLRQNDLTALNADASVVIQSDLAPMFAALMQAGLSGEWQCDQFFDFDYSHLEPVSEDEIEELTQVEPIEAGEYTVLIAEPEPLGGVETRDVARFIVDDLTQRLELEIPFSNVRVRGYPGVITTADEAKRIADLNGAAVIVWGNYTPDIIELNIDIGSPLATPYNDFPRDVLERTANVRVHMTGERDDSIALPVMSALNILAIANGSEFEYGLTLAIIDSLSGAPMPDIVGNTYAARLLRGTAIYLVDPDEAIELLTEVIEMDRGNPFGYLFRSTAYLYNGDLERFASDMETARRLGSPAWATMLASYQMVLDPFGMNIDLYDDMIKVRPDDWYLYHVRGFFWMLLGENELARADLEHSIALGPRTSMPYLVGTLVALREGRIEDAQDYMHTILTEYPDPQAIQQIMNVLMASQTDEMTGLLFSAMTLVSLEQYNDAALKMEEVLAALDDLPAADSATSPGALTDGDQAFVADAMLWAGLIQCNLDNHAAAEQFYSEGLSLNPDFTVLHVLRGQSRSAHDRADDAAADFDAARGHEWSDAWIDAALNGDWTCTNFFDYTLPE